MKEDLQLGYLVLGAADQGRLDSLFTEVLGLASETLPDGAISYRMDDWDRRFVVEQSEHNGLRGLGLVPGRRKCTPSWSARLEEGGV